MQKFRSKIWWIKGCNFIKNGVLLHITILILKPILCPVFFRQERF